MMPSYSLHRKKREKKNVERFVAELYIIPHWMTLLLMGTDDGFFGSGGVSVAAV
jgi:hypothetical protein